MKWLLWREYRLNRMNLAVGAVLLLLPYAILLPHAITSLVEGGRFIFFVFFFEDVGGVSIVLSWLTVSLLAGNAIAGERADRSAEIIANVPLEQWRRLASKVILFLIALAVVWGVNVLMGIVLLGPVRFAGEVEFWTTAFFLVVSLVIYCGGWLFSSLQSSPVIASAVGILTSVVVYVCAMTVANVPTEEMRGIPPHLLAGYFDTVSMWYAMIGLPVAVVCFSVGSWQYLRNSKP